MAAATTVAASKSAKSPKSTKAPGKGSIKSMKSTKAPGISVKSPKKRRH
eukprot:CAMPEP_0176048062 /NCGR_PEP_ID=MMETSP0120_2-20121206/23872_1 /TAXON_ID=160619 /ORGANISM="Kryptoperidinium foliaceum, Strain CCMP 1326" /LENGTH=48 /DNA_ID= /DNA_START= /DNA_END= /DNA_ORIENTATION=